jgi:membrane protein insertase Oxa1/YidC/SpoIIIJ
MWQFLFDELIYRPQLNIIQYLYNQTKDIGYTMIIVAIVFNLLAFRWFTKSFLNLQKRAALAQDFKNIQAYFKEKNRLIQEKIKELTKDSVKNEVEINTLNGHLRSALFEQQKLTKSLNQKFNIVGNYSLKTILLQLWISLGLYTIFRDITTNGAALKGLYPAFWGGKEYTDFGQSIKAFGNVDIAKSLTQTGLLWIPVLNALFTFFAMYYSFNYTTKPKVRELTDFEIKQREIIKLKNEKDGVPDIDPEKIAMQSQKLNLIMVPAMSLIFNFALPTGLNIYYCFLSILFFVRTWLADLYYKNHQYQYMTDILESGPVFPYEESSNELAKGNFDVSNTHSELVSFKKQ